MTPLMLSCCVKARGKLDIFFILLAAGADVTPKNINGHTVRDMAYMEEVEYVLRPMSDALDKHKSAPPLHKDVANVKKMFHDFDSCKWPWSNEKTSATSSAGHVEEESGNKAVAAWKEALKKIPFYPWAIWLKSQVKYDLDGETLRKKEARRKKVDMAKQAG